MVPLQRRLTLRTRCITIRRADRNHDIETPDVGGRTAGKDSACRFPSPSCGLPEQHQRGASATDHGGQQRKRAPGRGFGTVVAAGEEYEIESAPGQANSSAKINAVRNGVAHPESALNGAELLRREASGQIARQAREEATDERSGRRLRQLGFHFSKYRRMDLTAA